MAWTIGSRSVAQLALLALLALMGVGRIAHAEPSSADRLLAQSLFEEARKLMAQGDYAAACPKLAESQRLDPGGGTLLNLGLCHEAQGLTGRAWAEFNEALSVARRDGRREREELARKRIAALSPKLSRLSVLVSDDARVPGLQVQLDDALLAPAAWGTPIVVDPGRHEIRASAPKHRTRVIEVMIGAEADRKSISVTAPDPISPPKSEPAHEQPERSEPSADFRRPLGWTLAAAGVTGIAIGSYFGLRTFSKKNEYEKHCVENRCDAQGLELGNEARSAATVSTIGFAAGLAGLGAGIWLLTLSGEF